MPDHPLSHAIDIPSTGDGGKYWSALGRFVTQFAQVESMVWLTLLKFADVSVGVGRAVFSGARMDVGMNHITRIAEVLDLPVANKNELEHLFTQLRGIVRIRNDILHYGPALGVGGPEVLISNRLVALTDKRLNEIVITPRDLGLMSCDLLKIYVHLHRMVFPTNNPTEWTQSVLDAPWLYKLPTPNGDQKQPRSKSRKQRHQRQASPG